MIRTFKFVNVTYVAIVEGKIIENTIKIVYKNNKQVKKQVKDMLGEVIIKSISAPEIRVFKMDDYEFLKEATEVTAEEAAEEATEEG